MIVGWLVAQLTQLVTIINPWILEWASLGCSSGGGWIAAFITGNCSGLTITTVYRLDHQMYCQMVCFDPGPVTLHN